MTIEDVCYNFITGPLQSIHKALNIVLNSFEAVQAASGNTIDSSTIWKAREELARARNQLEQAEQNIRKAEQAQDQLKEQVKSGISAADELANKFSKLKNHRHPWNFSWYQETGRIIRSIHPHKSKAESDCG